MNEHERVEKLLTEAEKEVKQLAANGDKKHAALIAMLAREIRDQPQPKSWTTPEEAVISCKKKHVLDMDMYVESSGGRMCEVCGQQDYDDQEWCPCEWNEALDACLKAFAYIECPGTA